MNLFFFSFFFERRRSRFGPELADVRLNRPRLVFSAPPPFLYSSRFSKNFCHAKILSFCHCLRHSKSSKKNKLLILLFPPTQTFHLFFFFHRISDDGSFSCARKTFYVALPSLPLSYLPRTVVVSVNYSAVLGEALWRIVSQLVNRFFRSFSFVISISGAGFSFLKIYSSIIRHF